MGIGALFWGLPGIIGHVEKLLTIGEGVVKMDCGSSSCGAWLISKSVLLVVKLCGDRVTVLLL